MRSRVLLSQADALKILRPGQQLPLPFQECLRGALALLLERASRAAYYQRAENYSVNLSLKS